MGGKLKANRSMVSITLTNSPSRICYDQLQLDVQKQMRQEAYENKDKKEIEFN